MPRPAAERKCAAPPASAPRPEMQALTNACRTWLRPLVIRARRRRLASARTRRTLGATLGNTGPVSSSSETSVDARLTTGSGVTSSGTSDSTRGGRSIAGTGARGAGSSSGTSSSSTRLNGADGCAAVLDLTSMNQSGGSAGSDSSCAGAGASNASSAKLAGAVVAGAASSMASSAMIEGAASAGSTSSTAGCRTGSTPASAGASNRAS